MFLIIHPWLSAAMEFFDTIVIAVATLMEPLMASLIAYACSAGLLVRDMTYILTKNELSKLTFGLFLAWSPGLGRESSSSPRYIVCRLSFRR